MEKSKDTWTVLSSEYLHRAPWLTVRKDHVVLPNGNHIPSYYILEYPNWVNTIAITRDGQFVFIRQYRHGIQETSYELCAGVCEEEDGSPMVSAQRELLERVHANLSQSKYPHQHYLLFPGYGRGENLRATVGRYGKPDRTPAFLARGQGIAAARKHPPGADGCSPLEIHGGENYLM